MRLTASSLRQEVEALAAGDHRLGAIVDRHGIPPLWVRPAGFATLLQIVLEQQVSLASAAAMYQRLERALHHDVTPHSVAAAGEPFLRELGVTRQKARYLCDIAKQVQCRAFSFRSLARFSDDAAIEKLLRLPGVGLWTANIYLLMALRRPDAWPLGDLALHRALARLHQRSRLFTTPEAVLVAERWRPYRGVAARILWHAYICEKSDC